MSSGVAEDDLSPEKKRLLATEGHLIVLGGPGSGKTYIALRKAESVAAAGLLRAGQRVLFLSFARATVARVAQQALALLKAGRDSIEINTYHGFAWRLLQSHGYLLTGGRRITLLPPPEAKARLARVPQEDREDEMRRLLQEEGLLHFDLFAPLAADLLGRSQRIRNMISDAYPMIVLDEFQDTNADEWMVIQRLGMRSCLIALADAEQRIYDFRGADPKRISEFVAKYGPAQFDLARENRRSAGTDITTFGNDLLTGANVGRRYRQVEVVGSSFYKGRSQHFDLKTQVLGVLRRLRKTPGWPWSLAVLVPSRKLMLEISDYLSSIVDGLPSIDHEVALDGAGPALAATVIAGLMEAVGGQDRIVRRALNDLCEHVRGRMDSVSQANNKLVDALSDYARNSARLRGKNRLLVVAELERIAAARLEFDLSGDPEADWLAVRRLLDGSPANVVRDVMDDAKYLNLLHKGSILRTRLGELWRQNGSYEGAAAAVRDALLQEHFSTAVKDWRGIHVMTIHKSKGKEFDEIVLYEGMFQGRYLRPDASDEDVAKARLVLRVGVTRAMRRTTILTPKGRFRCPLL